MQEYAVALGRRKNAYWRETKGFGGTCTSSRSVRAVRTSCSPNRWASIARRERFRPPEAANPRSSYLRGSCGSACEPVNSEGDHSEVALLNDVCTELCTRGQSLAASRRVLYRRTHLSSCPVAGSTTTASSSLPNRTLCSGLAADRITCRVECTASHTPHHTCIARKCGVHDQGVLAVETLNPPPHHGHDGQLVRFPAGAVRSHSLSEVHIGHRVARHLPARWDEEREGPPR